MFKLFPHSIRPSYRASFRAYDGVNNLFNLAYRILFWKCYRGLIRRHLEPYLGFLHDTEIGRPSLVCDFMELYRYLIDDFLIDYSKDLKPTDFAPKVEMKGDRKGKRIYLKNEKTEEMLNELYQFFLKKVDVKRVRRGSRQELETLINEEAWVLGRYFRVGDRDWKPRIPQI